MVSPSAKEIYSEMSKRYVEIEVTTNEVDRERYQRAKAREALYNENWKKIKVNINEIVDKFTPDVEGKKKGEKFVFKNRAYIIKADMAVGYLRIYDRQRKIYIKPDGSPCLGRDESHFKILRKEEM